MKIFLTIFVALAAVQARPNRPYLDHSFYVPVREFPGFWSNKPMMNNLMTSLGRNRRIVNGKEALPHSHPYQVALYINDGWFCGGSIINLRTVLTAGHCSDGASSVFILAGAHNIDDWYEESQQWREESAENIRTHPNYNPDNVFNDIATIRILSDSPFEQTLEVQPIQLPRGTLQSQRFAGYIGTSVGWGTTEKGKGSSLLLYVENTIMTNAACAAIWGTASINVNKLCTATPEKKATCTGDSGGVISVFSYGVRIQVGLTSWGHADCEAGFPDVFERVSGHLSWIDLNSA